MWCKLCRYEVIVRLKVFIIPVCTVTSPVNKIPDIRKWNLRMN